MFKTQHDKEDFFKSLKDAMVNALKEIETWKEKKEKTDKILLQENE